MAYHKIGGSIIEGLVKNIVSGVLIEKGFIKGLKEGYGRTSDQMENPPEAAISVLLEGSHEWFHTNGNIRETGQYQNGERIGIWLSFDVLKFH